MELYNGKARDLLSRDKFLTPLAIRENKDKTFFCEASRSASWVYHLCKTFLPPSALAGHFCPFLAD